MATQQSIEQGVLTPFYPELYGLSLSESVVNDRYQTLLARHLERFGGSEAQLYSTSGRTELGGNHTDHNNGLVLTGSINLDSIAAVSPSEKKEIVFLSKGYPEIRVSLDDLERKESECGTTKSLIRGIARAMADKGVALTGWNASVESKVLPGSGLSSSASIEVLIATIINHLDAHDRFTPVELAQMGQYAENRYFGKPSGLLDQIGCAAGGIIAVDFEDPKKPVVKSMHASWSEAGYTMLVVDTKASHSNLTDAYASVPKEMKEVASYFGKQVLREVEPGLFQKEIPNLRKALQSDRPILRAIHYFAENGRVLEMVHALDKKDWDSYLSLVNQSGESSVSFLENAYKDPDRQAIPLALALSKEFLSGMGACRLQGGGFAGTIQAYVPDAMADGYKEMMEGVFGEGCCTSVVIRQKPTAFLA